MEKEPEKSAEELPVVSDLVRRLQHLRTRVAADGRANAVARLDQAIADAKRG